MQTQTAFLEALGWTLLDSCWQLGLLWGVLLLVRKGWPGLRAAAVYNIALFLVLAGMLWSGLTFAKYLLYPGSTAFRWPVSGALFAGWYGYTLKCIQVLLPYLSLLYIGWLTVRVIHFSRLYAGTSLLRREGLHKAPVDWRLFAGKMAAQMNIGAPFSVWLSEKADGPLLLGWLKPMILLPFSAVSQLSAEQVEAILIHELAHIRRNDFFWNMVLSLAEILFSFNPFARQLLATIHAEREHACDDWVLQFPVSTDSYAAALLKLEQQRRVALPPVALAAGGPHTKLLLWRVKRILQLPGTPPRADRKTGFLLSALVLVLVLLSVKPREEIRAVIHGLATSPLASLEARYETLVPPVPAVEKPAKQPVASVATRPATPAAEAKTAGDERNEEPDFIANAAGNSWDNTAAARFPLVLEAAARTSEEPLSFAHPETVSGYPADVATDEHLPYVPVKSFQTTWLEDSVVLVLKTLESQAAVAQLQQALKNLHSQRLEPALHKLGLSGAELRQALRKVLLQSDWSEAQQESATLTGKPEQQPAAAILEQEARLREAKARLQESLDRQPAESLQNRRLRTASDATRQLSGKRKTVYF
ncbi:MAG: M56 family metallopeptidase [Flavihumibacter sp.]